MVWRREQNCGSSQLGYRRWFRGKRCKHNNKGIHKARVAKHLRRCSAHQPRPRHNVIYNRTRCISQQIYNLNEVCGRSNKNLLLDLVWSDRFESLLVWEGAIIHEMLFCSSHYASLCSLLKQYEVICLQGWSPTSVHRGGQRLGKQKSGTFSSSSSSVRTWAEIYQSFLTAVGSRALVSIYLNKCCVSKFLLVH